MSVSAFDDLTRAAIRQAISEAGAGRLSKACEIGERALEDGGDQVALNAMLGAFRCRLGEFEAALRHLRPAHDARPLDVTIAVNLVAALVECGHHEEALAIASSELMNADKSLQLARYKGYIAQLLGDARSAAEAYEKIVAAAPSDWQSWNNLGSARLLCGDFDSAIAAFRRSLELNSDVAPTWLNLGRAFVKAGRLDEAENQFRMAADRFPADAQSLKELHDLLYRRGRPDQMLLDVLESAIGRGAKDSELLLALGQQRMISGDFKGAESAFRTVLAATPDDSEAYLELAKLYEHESPGNLSDLADEAGRQSVASPALDLIRAFALRRNRQYSEGVAALEHVPMDFKPWLTNELLGQFLDKLGDSDAAFAAFTRMNEAQTADPSQPLARAAQLRSLMRGRLELITAEWFAEWKTGPVPSERPAPVFLVGFPRSGTTLLDTMLMGHPDVMVMEERPTLDMVGGGFGGIEAIAGLDEEGIRQARKQYFQAVNRFVSAGNDKVLVDKNPLLLAQVPLIHRLFPDARFILALRHPADVILSCYFSNFRLTPALSNFLRLDTAAEFYDLVFRTWENARTIMPLTVYTVVYEQLVQNAEKQLRAIAQALELDWHDDMLDHRNTANARGIITTASYAQVIQPIYSSSVARWERYREQLKTVFPVLRPWIEKFGYSLP